MTESSNGSKHRLTGTIFIPGMAANGFQQEAVVRHGQSDVSNRPGSELRNPVDKTVKKKRSYNGRPKGKL